MWCRIVFCVALFGALAFAQEDRGDGKLIYAGEALTPEACRTVADRVKKNIETWTRMKYRRAVPITVQPRATWERAIRQQGYGGHAARKGAAFYSPLGNSVMVVPWVIGGYEMKPIPKLSRQEWTDRLESTIIHEFVHALHYQNFHVVPTASQMASMRTSGLSAREKDESTTDFLIAEGFAELVSFHTSSLAARALSRRPEREPNAPQRYWDRYQPNGKDPFRVLLFNTGYQDGLDLLGRLTRKAGPRAVRGVLYRMPSRELLFQPDILATVKFDDPPDPDSILAFLSPDGLEFGEVHLAVNPGRGRYFSRARSQTGTRRQKGCLLGFMASKGDEQAKHGLATYSFFVADPDAPGDWSAGQAETLRAMEPDRTLSKQVKLPHSKGVKADLISVRAKDRSQWVRAEANGMVVMARETKPTKNLRERVLIALRTLQIRRPTPNLYDAALKKARANLDRSKAD
jgi:hypothetical protein